MIFLNKILDNIIYCLILNHIEKEQQKKNGELGSILGSIIKAIKNKIQLFIFFVFYSFC